MMKTPRPPRTLRVSPRVDEETKEALKLYAATLKDTEQGEPSLSRLAFQLLKKGIPVGIQEQARVIVETRRATALKVKTQRAAKHRGYVAGKSHKRKITLAA